MDEQKNSFSFRKLPWGWILLGITLWFLFPWIFSVFFNLIIKNPKEYGESFGAVGDIFGSLNALISSIALCAVAYSTWLQVTSLKETREVNAKQLTLAKQAHDEQIIESQNAIFATKFYSLLNFKKDKLNTISIQRKVRFGDTEFRSIQESGIQAMDELAIKFCKLLKENNKLYSGFDKTELFEDFRKRCRELNYGQVSVLLSYFHIYTDLCRLIKISSISEEDRWFYKSILSNSMTQSEQILLFWISPMFGVIDIEDSEIFTLFVYSEIFKEFALEFHESSHFKSNKWKDAFAKVENPA
ncbi:hypothetical protein NQ666_12540 [Acinetobacter baumannii]|uniref:hypothetical protein n=1 Tax=Acinetobacter calcoaceticus/baumannii complex TaxID=909768 RepID=UPI001092C442|nr:hypothetical protein [Acinetobacter baumannii]MDC4454758.1 hypothetical protein [Acinetobacter baumannii]TGO93250.1 hypothetical protein E1953_13415 [Acinetobacter baumannii]